MKTLYIQCNMGCAGDMLMSALSELLPNKDPDTRRATAHIQRVVTKSALGIEPITP